MGHVKNKHGRILKPEIRKDKKRRKCRIHRLVAEAFIPNPDNLPMVNHKDENKLNNLASNLEWCDSTYNTHYSKHQDLSVYCFDLDEYFKSAAVHTGICRSSIVKACRGQLTQAGGKLWCYSRDKDKKFPS